MGEPAITYHLTPLAVWFTQASGDLYEPEDFAREGFIHCTDGEERVIDVGNRYYSADSRPFCLLTLARSRLNSPVVYEDLECVYPHIYGRLNIDAVVEVRRVMRNDDGRFTGIGASLPKS